MKETSIKNFLSKFFAIFCIIVVTSCSSLTPYKVPILQGNIFDEDDMSKLNAGLTKDQVQFIFGTALIKDPFHSNRWDYYYSIQVGDEVLDEMKLSINFNDDGLVDSWTIENLSE